jgi:arsenate reductase
MDVTLYGIKTCETVRKARAWLDAHGVAYRFHDYKSAGIDAAALQSWAGAFGWERVLNRAGTTFRALPEAQRTGLSEAAALALMQAQPSMIKRPIVEIDGRAAAIGFKPEAFAALFARAP